MQASTKLRQLLSQTKIIVAPGAIDCITSRAIERAGFDALYMTGAGTSMSLGYPDYGLITMTEMVENAARITKSVSIPLISDADTGYGNELNVYRTVQEFERAGVAGIHIEDQVFPKRCGHLDSKEVEKVLGGLKNSVNDVTQSISQTALNVKELFNQEGVTGEDIKGLINKTIVLFQEDLSNYRDWETDRKSTRLNSSH